MITFLDKWEMNEPQEKVNQDELFREMICYENDGKRIDMMAVIEHDGFVRAYNMDNGMYFNGEEEPDEMIPEDILAKVIEYAESQIQSDYEKSESYEIPEKD